MINIIWGFLIIVGIIYGVITNNVEVINNTIIDSSKVGKL